MRPKAKKWNKCWRFGAIYGKGQKQIHMPKEKGVMRRLILSLESQFGCEAKKRLVLKYLKHLYIALGRILK